MALNFEIEKLIKELKRIKPKKVLVQLPEGIKKNAFDISKTIKELGIEVIFSGESCWGGCAIAVDEAKKLGADLIIHFGHAKFISVKFPILYVEIKDELNLGRLLKKSLEGLKDFNKIGLSLAAQHKHELKKIIKFYENSGKKVFVSKKMGKSAYPGHIIGCEYSGLKAIQKNVGCFVIIGNNFHSMGAALSVNKPVFLVDVYNDDVKEMKDIKEKILKQRAIAIDKLRDAKKIGIIAEFKLGQKFGSAEFLAKKFKEKGKEVIIVSMNELSPDKLMNFYSVDCFIELGCPRIAIDDFSKYAKPIVTFKEALVGLGEKSWRGLLDEGIL